MVKKRDNLLNLCAISGFADLPGRFMPVRRALFGLGMLTNGNLDAAGCCCRGRGLSAWPEGAPRDCHQNIIAMRQIINHFTDDDLYKFTMCCAVIDNFPRARVKYALRTGMIPSIRLDSHRRSRSRS